MPDDSKAIWNRLERMLGGLVMDGIATLDGAHRYLLGAMDCGDEETYRVLTREALISDYKLFIKLNEK